MQVCAILSYFAVVHEWRDVVLHATLGFAHDVTLPEWMPALDIVSTSAVMALPDWATTGPPDALTVAAGTLFVAFWITQMFRMVYAATVDTLFVCMFREQHDDDSLEGRYHSRGEPSNAR